MSIFKKAEFKDIVRTETAFEKEAEYSLGVTAEKISRGLPSSIRIVDDTGTAVYRQRNMEGAAFVQGGQGGGIHVYL